MLSRIVWAIFTGAFAVFGGMLTGRFADFYMRYFDIAPPMYTHVAVQLIRMGLMFLGVLAGWMLGTLVYRKMLALAAEIGRLSLYDQLVGVLGAVIGVLLAAVICVPLLSQVKEPGLSVPVFVVVAIAAMLGGITWLRRLAAELVQQFPGLARVVYQRSDMRPYHRPKILDTNVIIDGRIRDICETGFLEGPLYIPDVVISEVQKKADSAEELDKARGRRGLETLETLRNEFPHLVSLLEGTPIVSGPDQSVDHQLIAVAKNLGAEIITSDRNLARAAEVQGIRVLNINQLVLSLRPEFVTGEQITLRLQRTGTEPGQGVGYLDDGTMVVVGNGADYIGQTVVVSVTNILQTRAGRTVFAELKEVAPAAEAATAERVQRDRASGRAKPPGGNND